jgi:DNA-directed RNA polymerase specialized sigma24 family protein
LEGGVLFEAVAGGEDHMQATAAYIGSEQHLDIAAPEKETREPQDVFSRYLPLLYRTAYRYLGNAPDAEDAVQDALLSAYKHLDQFRGQAQISTWLVAIVSNCARMQLRRRPRQIHVSLNEQFGDEEGYTVSERLVDGAPSPEEEYRKVDGLTISEAAQILGVVDGTVKAQVARARAKLTRLVRRALDARPRSSVPRMPLQVAEGK